MRHGYWKGFWIFWTDVLLLPESCRPNANEFVASVLNFFCDKASCWIRCYNDGCRSEVLSCIVCLRFRCHVGEMGEFLSTGTSCWVRFEIQFCERKFVVLGTEWFSWSGHSDSISGLQSSEGLWRNKSPFCWVPAYRSRYVYCFYCIEQYYTVQFTIPHKCLMFVTTSIL